MNKCVLPASCSGGSSHRTAGDFTAPTGVVWSDLQHLPLLQRRTRARRRRGATAPRAPQHCGGGRTYTSPTANLVLRKLPQRNVPKVLGRARARQMWATQSSSPAHPEQEEEERNESPDAHPKKRICESMNECVCVRDEVWRGNDDAKA